MEWRSREMDVYIQHAVVMHHSIRRNIKKAYRGMGANIALKIIKLTDGFLIKTASLNFWVSKITYLGFIPAS